MASLDELVELLERNSEWPGLIAALRSEQSGVIDGAWGSAAALALIAMSRAAPSALLVVLAHPGDVDGWLQDLHTWSGQTPAAFLGLDNWPPERARADPVVRKRFGFVQRLAPQPRQIYVTTIQALMQPVPTADALKTRQKKVRHGQNLDLEQLLAWLIENHYQRVDAVEMPGEYARRGGIVDIYSPASDDPYRIELDGDTVDSVRTFSPVTQRSLAECGEATFLDNRLVQDEELQRLRGSLLDHLPDQCWVALVEPQELHDQGHFFVNNASDMVGLFQVAGIFKQLLRFANVTISAMPRPSIEHSVHLRVESVERFSGNIARVSDELAAVARNDRVIITCQTEAERNRLRQVLAAGKLTESHQLQLAHGSIRSGFRLVEHGVIVLGSHELFHRELTPTGEKIGEPTGLPKRRIESRAIDSFLELNEGDLVVHVLNGIARFRGMKMIARASTTAARSEEDDGDAGDTNPPIEEHLLLEFRDGVLLYVPVSKVDLVQKYVGGTGTPELSKLGGSSWNKRKERVEEAVLDLATEMIEIQALRAAQPGIAFEPDSEWMKEFENSFPFQETPDQLTAIREIKSDLESPRPMDRLLCGDVGYGKTELAVRAAFKVIDNGKQVAVLVPTTILAEQHYRTFTERLSPYPFIVEAVSRFRSPGEQRAIIKRAQAGEVDVIIGTHRLLSKDVQFKDLGLVIIDEEQRFGVHHKERLKQMRTLVHVLTMTATPIPRTLHLALLGIRDISNLETPPPERLPVETRIIRWDDTMIRSAILRELNRDGQVYFVHNRVHDIRDVARRLQGIVPEAQIVVGHGQMTEVELEAAMVQFVQKKAHILVATTIIESGLDIPNANTIFIDEADIYGLADLHQLRGRVGRQKNRAYAYMLLHEHRAVTPNAEKRLKAIEEFAELGAGFKIAMRDLEIRGAGNILGMEQSGHIAAIGYELYCQLLENAVRNLKSMPLRTPLDVHIDLAWNAFLPRDYVYSQKARMEIYRRLARIRDRALLDDFRLELRDRHGAVPLAAEWLIKTAEIRLLASRWQITNIHRHGPHIILTYKNSLIIKQLADRHPTRLKIIDEKSVYVRLQDSDVSAQEIFSLLLHVLGSD